MAIISYNGNDDISTAENFIRDQTALYRHYQIEEVQASVHQFTGVSLSTEETIELVQAARDQAGMGPIAEYNLPGYEEEEIRTQRGGLLGWLFGG